MDTVLERIAQKLVARLEQITLANGYTRDIVNVDRPNPSFKAIDHNWIVILPGDPESSVLPGNPPRTNWWQPYTLDLALRPADSDPTPIDKLLNDFEADVVQAIAQPAVDWHNWDGLAINSEWGEPVPFTAADDSLVGRSLTLRINYRTDEGNLRNVRY